jgi:hypothetical protein
MLRTIWAYLAAVVALASVVAPSLGDEAVVNTPAVTGKLQGAWEMVPAGKGDFKQRLTLGRQLSGEWQMSEAELPVTMAWFVEGGELRVLYYHEPKEVNNYRVKDLIFKYRVDGDSLSLTRDGKTTSWKRMKDAGDPAK